MEGNGNNEILHNDGAQIAGFLGAVVLTLPIIIRLAAGDGRAWDWIFLAIGLCLTTYWVVLAFRGRRIRQRERWNLKDE